MLKKSTGSFPPLPIACPQVDMAKETGQLTNSGQIRTVNIVKVHFLDSIISTLQLYQLSSYIDQSPTFNMKNDKIVKIHQSVIKQSYTCISYIMQ